VAVFLVALHRFERAEHAEFAFDRHADRVRHLDDLARHVDVVLVDATVLPSASSEPSIITR
jgi:hypothetical protein